MPSESFHAQVLRALVHGGARLVVVGGVAVNIQGVPRFTADLDVAIALDSTTLHAVTAALTGLGLQPRLPVPAAHFADPLIVQDWIENRNLKAFTFQDAHDPLRQVDVLLACGVPFDEIAGSAEIVHAFGVQVPVASIDMLIRMKSGTGRAQDASDVEALTRVREARRNGT
jgi:hypothetical protein